MDAREDTRPFLYSGYDHCGNPQDMLEDTRDGLWAAVHMVEACEVVQPTPMAMKGLGHLLRGLVTTLESAQDIIQERASNPSAGECATRADRPAAPGNARQLREMLKEGRFVDGAAE